MEVKGRKWTKAELEQVIELVGELVNANETLNSQMIAMNAKLENEEKKVKRLQQHLAQLSLMFTNNTYEA
jgi:predicted nuclease with TOPRIM domain